jgi:N utilization substance protein B
MRKGSRHMARRAAVQALYQWQLTGQAPAEIQSHFMPGHELESIDTEYFQHLLKEIPLHQTQLDEHLTPHLDRKVLEVDPVELACLRLGAYEFEFHPEIPYKVVLNEAVELAKIFGAEHGHKYVNAILDKLAQKLRPHEARASAG